MASPRILAAILFSALLVACGGSDDEPTYEEVLAECIENVQEITRDAGRTPGPESELRSNCEDAYPREVYDPER